MSQKLTYQRNMEEQNPFLNRDEEPAPEPELQVVKPEVKREPIRIGPSGIEINDTDQAVRFASVYYKSKLYPNSFKTPEQIVIAVLRAKELGLPVFQALEGMSVINNRCGLMGDLALSLVESSGLLETKKVKYDGEGDDLVCTLTVKRKGRDAQDYTFSVAEAKQANIYERSSVWKSYPKRMCYYRALGFALRDEFSDVLKGMKTTEELADYPTNE